jgi:putative transcriptional regulator
MAAASGVDLLPAQSLIKVVLGVSANSLSLAESTPTWDSGKEFAAMTQEELVDAIGVTRQTVAAIEQRAYSPSLKSAFRIAQIFGVGIEKVFKWDE